MPRPSGSYNRKGITSPRGKRYRLHPRTPEQVARLAETRARWYARVRAGGYVPADPRLEYDRDYWLQRKREMRARLLMRPNSTHPDRERRAINR